MRYVTAIASLSRCARISDATVSPSSESAGRPRPWSEAPVFEEAPGAFGQTVEDLLNSDERARVLVTSAERASHKQAVPTF